MWEFDTDPEYQKQLDWAAEFVRERVEPMDLLFGSPFDRSDVVATRLARSLREQVRERGLWACHLRPEHGGQGYGQLQLALLNETIGHSRWAPSIFGCQAPDSGNAEVLAVHGTPEQQRRYLTPLLAGEISSSYAMTEPHAGADPALFTTSVVRDGAGWRLDGEKWFASYARYADFHLVLAVSDPGVDVHDGLSLLLVPAETPGVEIIRNVGTGQQPDGDGGHAYLRFTGVRLPADALLGSPGGGFAAAQLRLSGGRMHHAMRTVGHARKAFTMLCERAVSRTTRTGRLADLQLTREAVADSWIELEQFRLLVLRTAWLIDKHGQDYGRLRKDIAAVKVAMPKVLHEITRRALHLHGALGVSNEMPFWELMVQAEIVAVADGPTEVHKLTVAREVLRDVAPADGLFPTQHLPQRRAWARRRLAEMTGELTGELAGEPA